jgi:hypothetical protein
MLGNTGRRFRTGGKGTKQSKERQCKSVIDFLVLINLTGKLQILASICLMRGKAFISLQNRVRAAYWFKEALKKDSCCYEVRLFEKKKKI